MWIRADVTFVASINSSDNARFSWGCIVVKYGVVHCAHLLSARLQEGRPIRRQIWEDITLVLLRHVDDVDSVDEDGEDDGEDIYDEYVEEDENYSGYEEAF